jgi:hypothetical protein
MKGIREGGVKRASPHDFTGYFTFHFTPMAEETQAKETR